MPANGQRPSCPLLGVSKAGQKTATDALAAKLDCGRIMQVAFASAPSNIGVFDCEGRVLLANPALQSYFGTDFEEIYGKVVGDIPHHADFSSLQASIQETATKARPTALEIPLEDADGKAEVHIINLVPALSSSGETMYVIGYGRNIANIERLKAAVAEAEDQLHAAVRVLPDIFWVKNTEGRYLLCNEEFDRFNRIARNSALGGKASDLSEGEIYEIHRKTDEQALTSTEPVRFQLEIPQDENNETRFYEVQKIAIRDSAGEVSGLLGLARNITNQRKLENELRTREREYRLLAEHLPDCLIRYDASAKPVYMNAAVRHTLKERLGLDPVALMEDRQKLHANKAVFADLRNVVSEVLEYGKPQQTEITLKAPNGDEIVFELRLFPEFDDNGQTTSVVGVGRDITETKIAERQLKLNEQELRRLAYTDHLTGLANRTTFTTTLTEQLESTIAKGKKMALLTLDIDRLKTINDTLGHTAGDELLQVMAWRLEEVAASAAWIGRLGGDEFALILPDLDTPECAEAMAERIIQEASMPMVLGDNTINVSISIGITIGPDDSSCPSALFRHSDIALYSAKALGRGRYCRYDEDMSRAINKRFEMEAMINEGLRSDQFVAHFQPKIDLGTLELHGAEALCRWTHPEKGMIPPAEFITIAEETGQIIEIGRRILKQSCEVAFECNRSRTDPFVIAVNVSARQLLYGGFLGTLGRCLEETGCKASWLELEITESLLLIDDAAIIETLNSISQLGITVSLDDFGTGYSSLSYLQKFPISGLKIDQSFIRELEKGGKQGVLVRTILTMAQSLGLKTVAEGIETAEIAAWLTELGCDEGQGYFWHRPMPAESLFELIAGFLPQPSFLSAGADGSAC